MVRSPLTAASATFALKAGEWFRRGRLLMVSPVHGDYRRYQAEIPLIVLSRFPGPALTVAQRSCKLGISIEALPSDSRCFHTSTMRRLNPSPRQPSPKRQLTPSVTSCLKAGSAEH